MTRIAFIGAGSVEFTRDLLGDLLGFAELGDVEVALHDIDPERLSTGEAMARWTAPSSARADDQRPRRPPRRARRRRLRDQHDPGRRPRRHLTDFEIPARHGLRQTIGDTLGIGGIFRALRTIPVMLGIGDDMAELCPDAWLLNYTNPMAMLCQAYAHGSPHTKVVGLCHSVQHTTRRLAELAGVPFEEVTFLGAGVNHQAFILRFERDGEDLYPRLDAAIEADPELRRTVRVELYRRFGYFPTESSEHSAEYLPWLMHDDAAIEHFRIPVDEYVRRSEENLELYEELKTGAGVRRRLRDRAQPRVRTADHPRDDDRRAGGDLRQRPQRRPDRQPAGRGVRRGAVRGRPDRRAADARGSAARAVRRAQPHVPQRRRADRARPRWRRDRDLVHQAALLDPNAAASLDLDTIRAVCDELLAAHADALAPGLRG